MVDVLYDYWYGADDSVVKEGAYNVSWLSDGGDPCTFFSRVSRDSSYAAWSGAGYAGTVLALDSDTMACCRETVSHALALMGCVAGIIYEKSVPVAGSGYFRTCRMPTDRERLAPILGLNYDKEPAWREAVSYAQGTNATEYSTSPVTLHYSRVSPSEFAAFLKSPLVFVTFRVVLPAAAAAQACVCALLLLRRRTSSGRIIIVPPGCCRCCSC